MKSKMEGHSYVILQDGERFPVKLNRKRTDKSLLELKTSLEKVRVLMKELYASDYDLYSFLRDSVLRGSRFDFDEGDSSFLDSLLYDITSVHEYILTHTDEIKSREELESLEDLGYRRRLGFSDPGAPLYEKILEDTDEKEIVEEIIEVKGKVFRHVVTTYWKKTDFGRASCKIFNKRIGVPKRLVKAYRNSVVFNDYGS